MSTSSQSKSESASESPRYEELMNQLETIVDQIESGDSGLEESIKGYEQGMELVKKARALLNQAEQRIIELNADQIDDSSSD